MVKALFALAKPLVSRCCVANTHVANIYFQPISNACSSCFKQYFPFLPGGPGGENIHNYVIKSLLVLIILLNPLPVLIALKILRDILSFTRSFMINTRPLVECLENSDRKVEQFRVIPRIASSRLDYAPINVKPEERESGNPREFDCDANPQGGDFDLTSCI